MTYAATGQTGRIYELMASWQTGIPKTCKKWAHYFRNCHYNVFVHTLAAVGNRQEFSLELSCTLCIILARIFLWFVYSIILENPDNRKTFYILSQLTEQCKNILKLHQTFFFKFIAGYFFPNWSYNQIDQICTD